MANVSKNTQHGYLDFTNLVVQYNDGDVRVLDSIRDISQLYPLKPMTNIIAICCSGHTKLASGGRTIDFGQGNLLICPPNIRLESGERTEDFECRVLCLTDHIISELLRDKIDVWHQAVYVNQLNIVSISEVCNEEFMLYLSLIRSKVNNRQEQSPREILLALVRIQLLELCWILANRPETESNLKLSQGKILFNRFLGLVSNNPVKRRPIAEYASQLAITPKYLTMLCLKYSNKTASDWVIQYTIEEIRFYLRSSNLSIKEISAKLGFSNMSHFGSYVRKHLGVSPSDFRHGKEVTTR
ncbi:MAG: AraC family transcriptional regulator [Prevotella sp.]|nr:AraC family transcriptional regulator [Prevotella sp.]